jgi:hypothetical protein
MSATEDKTNPRYIGLVFVLLVAAALACNRTVPTATPPDSTAMPVAATDTVAPIPSATATTTTAMIATATATATPAGSAAPTAETTACVFDAEFVTDVTVPDDTELEPDAGFVKTWRMRNSGDCVWEPGTVWVSVAGESMQGPESVAVPATEPGDEVDISVDLTAPAEEGTYTGYWRLARPSGEAFGMRGFVRIKVVAPSGGPTPSPSPTSDGEADLGPVIEVFRSDVDEADPGDTVILEWESKGATDAALYHLLPTGQLGTYWEVDVSGTFEYEIDAAERNFTRFLLVVSDDADNSTRASLSIPLRCPDTWFFEPAPEGCPASAAVTSAGAEQHFERGVMVWVAEEGVIYVLFDDGHSPWWRGYPDEWEPGDPESNPDIVPPAGLIQPVRGFGLVWRDQLDVRDRLGWAIDTEAAFDTAVQRTSRAKYNDMFIRALDGTVWKLLPESSGWETVP